MKKAYLDALKKVARDSILQTRTALGLSQEQMAARLYMSARSYSYLESGTSCCSALTLVLYLVFCCPDVSSFFSVLRAEFEKVNRAA